MGLKDTIDFRTPSERAVDWIDGLARMAHLQKDAHVAAAKHILNATRNAKRIEQVVRKTEAILTSTPQFRRAVRYPELFRCPGALGSGPIGIGTTYDVISNRCFNFGLNFNPCGHYGIVGSTGFGKTTSIFVMAQGLHRHGIRCMAFDAKQDMRHLIKTPLGSDLLIFNEKTLPWNVLRPPRDVDPRHWIQIFANVFGESLNPEGGSASRNLLIKLIEWLYRKHGVFDVSPGEEERPYPTILELHRLLQPGGDLPLSNRELQAAETLRSRTVMLIHLIGPMLAHDTGFSIEDTLRHHCTMELNGLTFALREFITTLWANAIFAYKMSIGDRGPTPTNALIIDEAMAPLSPERVKQTSEWARLFSTSREYRISFIVASQSSRFADPIRSNLNTLIVFNLPYYKDQDDLAASLGLNADQKKVLPNLQNQEAIVRVLNRFPYPVRVRIDNFHLEKDVSDAAIARHMAGFLGRYSSRHSWNESVSAPPTGSEDNVDEQPAQRSAMAKAAKPTKLCPPSKKDLPSLAITLLLDIRDRPLEPATQRYARLGLDSKKASALKKVLLEARWIREINILAGRTGRPIKFFELTEPAIKRWGAQKLPHGRGAGLEHSYWQLRIREHYQSLGYEARMEAHLNGTYADVGVFRLKSKTAIEIAITTGAEYEVAKALREIESGWDRVQILFTDQNHLGAARKILVQEIRDPEKTAKVELFFLHHFLPN